jgi:endonuclease YncB( thermonuclease family)
MIGKVTRDWASVSQEMVLDGAARAVELTPLRIARFAGGDLNQIRCKFRVGV